MTAQDQRPDACGASAAARTGWVVLTEENLPGLDPLEHPYIERAEHGFGDAIRPDVGGLIVVGAQIGEAVLRSYPNLRVVAKFGVGVDNIDLTACSERGVQVGVTPGVVEEATAELTLALMLSLARSVVEHDALVRTGGWSPNIDVLPAVTGLCDLTLGVVGLGRIGTRVARLAQCFGMRVHYFSRRRSSSAEADLGLVYQPLHDLLQSVDVVSIHCPLTDETRGLIGAEELAMMKPGAMLINTSRGDVIDEPALVGAVAAGRLRAGLDVFRGEPQVPEELRRSGGCVLSPHVGSAVTSARLGMTQMCLANVTAALSGDRIPHPAAPPPI